MEPNPVSIYIGVLVVYCLVVGLPMAIAGYMLLDRFDKGGTGAMVSFLLGPMGILIAWIMRDNEFRDREEAERKRAMDAAKPARDPHEPRRFR